MASTVPWVEKYRPATIDQVAHQEQAVKTLRNALQTGNLPHLLFYGPPGTGKTSTILALAKDLYGPELYKSRVLELNASDERGIEVVRNKIKNFASLSVSSTAGGKSHGHPCPPFKLIVLDEADSMTTDAQSALRRTMETYTRVTRFCIICNYVSRIIGPIASRCAKFHFANLPKEIMVTRLTEIAAKENFTLDPAIADELMNVSGGDLRKAITLLQNCHVLHGKQITPKNITEAGSHIPDNILEELMAACRSNSFENAENAVYNIIAEGYPAHQLLSQLSGHLMGEGGKALSSKSKAIMCKHLGSTDKCLVDGADETIQLLSFAAVAMQAIQAA